MVVFKICKENLQAVLSKHMKVSLSSKPGDSLPPQRKAGWNQTLKTDDEKELELCGMSFPHKGEQGIQRALHIYRVENLVLI